MKKNFKKIIWNRVLLTILPPLLFAWPVLPNYVPFPFKNRLAISVSDLSVESTQLPKEFPINGAGDSIGSKAVLSTLLGGVKTASMPVELCFSNKNQIFEGDKKINSATLLDAEEAGAMSFKFKYINTDITNEIYVKMGDIDKCKVIPSEGIVLSNSGIEVRKPWPLKVKALSNTEGIEIKVEPANIYVLLYKNPGYYQVRWQTSIFLSNFILFLLAWWGLTSLFRTMMSYLIREKVEEENNTQNNESEK